MERRSYKKIPLVEFEDVYCSDFQNSFWPNRAKIRGILRLVTQISGWTLNFSGKKLGGKCEFLGFWSEEWMWLVILG